MLQVKGQVGDEWVDGLTDRWFFAICVCRTFCCVAFNSCLFKSVVNSASWLLDCMCCCTVHVPAQAGLNILGWWKLLFVHFPGWPYMPACQKSSLVQNQIRVQDLAICCSRYVQLERFRLISMTPQCSTCGWSACLAHVRLLMQRPTQDVLLSTEWPFPGRLLVYVCAAWQNFIEHWGKERLDLFFLMRWDEEVVHVADTPAAMLHNFLHSLDGAQQHVQLCQGGLAERSSTQMKSSRVFGKKLKVTADK